MRKFLWKLHYVFLMWQRARITLSFCWDSAGASIENNEDWMADGADCCVSEDMSVWSD